MFRLLVCGNIRESAWLAKAKAGAGDSGFSLCLVSLVLEHFDDARPLVQAAAALLTGGGVLVLAERSADALRPVGHLERPADAYGLLGTLHNELDLAQALTTAGFVEVTSAPDDSGLLRIVRGVLGS